LPHHDTLTDRHDHANERRPDTDKRADRLYDADALHELDRVNDGLDGAVIDHGLTDHDALDVVARFGPDWQGQPHGEQGQDGKG